VPRAERHPNTLSPRRFEGLVLLRREDLREPGLHFLLELPNLLLLLRGQVQPLLEERGEDLTGLGRALSNARGEPARTARSEPTPAARTARVPEPEGWLFLLGLFFRFPLPRCDQRHHYEDGPGQDQQQSIFARR
jgi:hypothetical protein